MATNNIYNINEMRKALLKAYEEGNNRAISKKDCDSLGITKGYYDTYINNLKALYEAICEYSRKKHTPNTSEVEVKEAFEKIFPSWKIFMECGEKSKHSKDFRVDVYDIYDLVGFCQKFMFVSNEEGSTKAWASETFNAFRKKCETMLGIKIAKAEMLSDEMRDFLVKEKSILNRIKKTTTVVEEKEELVKALKARVKNANNAVIEAFMAEDIRALEIEIQEAKTRLKTLKSELVTHRQTMPRS